MFLLLNKTQEVGREVYRCRHMHMPLESVLKLLNIFPTFYV